MLYCLYRIKKELLTGGSLKAFSFHPAEMNLKLLFIWEKVGENNIYFAPVVGGCSGGGFV